MGFNYTGKYTQAFLSNEKVKSESMEADFFDNKINIQPNEGVYVYSFKGNKLLYAKGFEKALKIKDDELSMLELNSHYTPEFEKFINEYHDRILLFLYNNNENIDTFSSYSLLKINDMEYPFMLNIKVFDTDANGNLLSMIGRCTFDNSLKSSDIVQYSIQGDLNEEFHNTMNYDLEFQNCISLSSIKLIERLEQKKTIKEISSELEMNEVHINNIIDKLFKRFKLSNNLELINFAKSNHLIPNQFEDYMNN